VTVQTAYDPRIIVPGDFNGDGVNDLATAHTTAGMMAVLIILKRITEGTQDSWATLVLRATP